MSHSQLPAVGWQHTLASALTGFASRDERILDIRVHGSTADCGETLDQWSDLDLMITTSEPLAVAEDLAQEIAEHHAPVFASNQSGDTDRHTRRLVLCDLRRLDLTFVAASPRGAPKAVTAPPPDVRGLIDPLVNDFRFDAVLAVCKAARHDVLIGAHLTLGLARHILVAAMVLRDRSKGTTHHRHGDTRYDTWATRLAAAPPPYDPVAIASAIRYYTVALRDLLTEHGVHSRLDNGPLLALLDTVDDHTFSSPSTLRAE
ncbi:hypothetical protein [Streptomyces alanosinicus]|uniref:Uncharacterized protein n=1 Tax=Streptomyces alanosinicus TaxID=68171 RepID=A0A918YQE6_9ACTN|nr:hypothetical protein [Streptomyces alanosinicus]GHE12828.1 hypothetical protein GCM10010339_77770 [Streptomyces alanosinicus]